jgi:hypothetical protein
LPLAGTCSAPPSQAPPTMAVGFPGVGYPGGYPGPYQNGFSGCCPPPPCPQPCPSSYGWVDCWTQNLRGCTAIVAVNFTATGAGLGTLAIDVDTRAVSFPVTSVDATFNYEYSGQLYCSSAQPIFTSACGSCYTLLFPNVAASLFPPAPGSGFGTASIRFTAV